MGRDDAALLADEGEERRTLLPGGSKVVAVEVGRVVSAVPAASGQIIEPVELFCCEDEDRSDAVATQGEPWTILSLSPCESQLVGSLVKRQKE